MASPTNESGIHSPLRLKHNSIKDASRLVAVVRLVPPKCLLKCIVKIDSFVKLFSSSFNLYTHCGVWVHQYLYQVSMKPIVKYAIDHKSTFQCFLVLDLTTYSLGRKINNGDKQEALQEHIPLPCLSCGMWNGLDKCETVYSKCSKLFLVLSRA